MKKPLLKIQKLPDPHGMISRIKAKLPKSCAVARSQYCEIIISMRMQGVDYRAIEQWLTEQGEEHRISPTTIWRNLKKTNLTVELPYAEELAEKWGGRIDIDLARELTGQIVAQRLRVDSIQRHEVEKQRTNPRYYDRRLRQERELLASLIKTLHGMMKTPAEAARELMEGSGLLSQLSLKMTTDAQSILKEMILSGELILGESPQTRH